MAYGDNPYVNMMSNLNKITNGKGTTPEGQEHFGRRHGSGLPSQPPSPTPYSEGQYQYDTSAGMETTSVEDIMSREGGALGADYINEFVGRLTNLSSEDRNQFKEFLGDGIDSSEWGQLVGLTAQESEDYKSWFQDLPGFSNIQSQIANIEEYGKARKKQARSAARSRLMQEQQAGGGGRGFSRGKAMLGGSLKRSLLRDAMNAQTFNINEAVGKRYGDLVASVGDAFSKAYRNLRGLTADVGTDTPLAMFENKAQTRKEEEERAKAEATAAANQPPPFQGREGTIENYNGITWQFTNGGWQPLSTPGGQYG